eukprot:1795729-Rhodomonas_salina.1
MQQNPARATSLPACATPQPSMCNTTAQHVHASQSHRQRDRYAPRRAHAPRRKQAQQPKRRGPSVV